MMPLASWIIAVLLAGEPVDRREVARELDDIFEHERYYFCEADTNYVPNEADQRWCELAAQHDTSRCPGFARVCGHMLETPEVESMPMEESTQWESKPKDSSDPGEVNQIAHDDDRESFRLPDLGGFAKVLMWILLIGLAIGVIAAIVRNFVRDRSEDSDAPEPQDAGESLVAAKIEALRVVETDVQRLLARAEAAAARGDYAAGIADLHAALLRRLEGARLISLDRWKTNGDYLRALRSRPDLRDEVREVVREVEQVQFGASPAGRERYAEIRAAVLAIVGRAALALALGLGLGAHTACDDNSEATVSALAGLGTGPSDQRAVGELLLRFDIRAHHRSRDIEQLAQTQGAIVLLADVSLTAGDWQRLLEWVENDAGVLIVATGADFPRELGIDYMPGPELTTDLTAVTSQQMFTALDCAAPAGRTLSARMSVPGPTNVVLARPIVQPFAALFGPSQATDEEPYLMQRRLGTGQIFVFAESDMLTNAGLLIADNGACLINLLRSADVEELEFVNSYTGAGADNPVDSVRKAKLGAVFLQTLLFLALLYAMVGLPFARLRDPPAQRRRAFVEHVRTLGQRYAQSRAAHYVGVHYCTWALDRMRARLQPGSARGIHALAVAVAARTGRPETEVMQILVEAHELRESHVSAARGGASELELMRRLSALLAQIR